MRKALIAAAVATALFAVGAFAASFTLSAEDVASGTDQVKACAQNVTVDFDDDMEYSAGQWKVETVTVAFLNGTTPTTGCAGFDGTLVITNIGGGVLHEQDFDVPASPATSATITLTTPRNVSDIYGAGVLVEGVHMTVTPL
jgi:hypothetical protein